MIKFTDPVSQSKITQFCHLYNRQDCLKNENTTCNGRVECDGAMLRDKAACMVTWSNTSDKVVLPKLLGNEAYYFHSSTFLSIVVVHGMRKITT